MRTELEAEDERDYPQTHNAPAECDVVEKADESPNPRDSWWELNETFIPETGQMACVCRERENGKLK